MERYIQVFLIFVCSLLFLPGCQKPVDISEADKYETILDSLEKMATDSLFSNNAYSRTLLRSNMNVASDSLAYYRLMAVYSKVCFAAAQFDSVLYYNHSVLGYCKRIPETPHVQDLVSIIYNLAGNVWTQLSRPDSAIVCYKKAYDHREKGLKHAYLPDLCINLADACIHKGGYADAAYYYRRALFLCDSLNLPDLNKFPIYYGLGQTYMELRDFDLSNRYYEMAESYFSQMNPTEKFTYLNNRGNLFYYKKDYSKYLGFL